MTETSEGYEARHREAAGYLEQHKPAPSSPTGETPLHSLSETRHCEPCGGAPCGLAYAPPPTGETPCATCGGTGYLDYDETIGQRRLCPDCPPTPCACACHRDADDSHGCEHCQPTGETGQGERRDQNPPHGAGDDGLCVSCGFSWPCRGAAGQGVEEAWERIEETRDSHGVEVAVWRQSRPTWTDIRAVPIAVEDEIAHRFALDQYDILRARAERAEARATAAEAERERLREALRELFEADKEESIYDIEDKDEATHAAWKERLMRKVAAIDAARRALAGESTGAGEGE